ncbi:hypothetical protein HPB48_014457 [Haemaphysalis longicornis]|uniref:EB domain-containing protein n=1 Tax=Haemaphysalis longicornis TaxID=44386 RepID=A0A9J6H2N0_HAELO|nr:hypothetical protein HPB48_014457 [Haemaphysalis longicornis]
MTVTASETLSNCRYWHQEKERANHKNRGGSSEDSSILTRLIIQGPTDNVNKDDTRIQQDNAAENNDASPRRRNRFALGASRALRYTHYRRNFGQPCARDDDCRSERGLSCQEWVCRCAFDTPVRVQVQGIDTCLAAKYLYESCRYNQECSHRNAHMRCVDFLCYCPLPFELRANGDCLEARPSLGKLIAAISPAALLLIIMGTIGGTFIFRKIFHGEEQDDNTINFLRQNEQILSTQRSAATASVSIRTGPLKSWRPKKSQPPSNSRSPRPISPPVPFTRLLRVPPDQLRPDTFSPDPTSTTTVMKTSSFSPPVPFEKSSLTPFDKSSRRSAGRPPHLSVTGLMEKVFRSSTDSSEDDGIVLRVRRDSNRGAPAPKPSRKDSLALVRSGQRRGLLSFRKDNTINKDVDESAPSYEWEVTAPTHAATRDKTVAAEAEERPEKNTEQDNHSPHTLSSPFRRSKCVKFADDAISGAASDHQRFEKPPAGMTLKGVPSARFDGGMRVGSLKAETRFLSLDTRPTAAPVKRQQFWMAGLAQGDRAYDAATAKSIGVDKSRTETSSQGEVLSLGERNRLGVGTPFVSNEDSPFAESASIALSFLRSASPSYEVLPKPDINSSMLRAADALLFPAAEDDEVSGTRKKLNASLQNAEDSAGHAEDAKLVATFLSAVLEEPSSSDGAPAPSCCA